MPALSQETQKTTTPTAPTRAPEASARQDNRSNAEQAAKVEGGTTNAPLDRAEELLRNGDLLATANHLTAVAAEQRRLWSGGGDRQLLSTALATLAVTQDLIKAQTAKEAGQGAAATQAARAAMGTLERAVQVPESLRRLLTALGDSFGAVTVAQPQAATTTGAATSTDKPTPKPTKPAEASAQPRAGYDPVLGRSLARRASSGAPGTVGRCYEFVANAVDDVIGPFLTGGHAYMAASQFAARPNLFTEISAGGLSSLPAGAIVVWSKGTSRSGHISVALGDGREASDHVTSQMTRHYGGGGARVFLPKAKMR